MSNTEKEKLNGIFRGEVIKHLSNGFCKIWIPGIYPSAWKENPDMLPSAEQASSLFAGTCDGNGVFTYPNIGSTVWCMFENGDLNLPVYIASTLGNAQSSYELTNDEDTTSLEDTANHYVNSGNSHIWIELSGIIKIQTNDSKNSSIKIDKDGNINVNSDTTIIAKSPDVHITGNSHVTVDSDALVDVKAPNVHITGTTLIDGNTTINGTLHVSDNITTAADVIANCSLNNHTHTGLTTVCALGGPWSGSTDTPT